MSVARNTPTRQVETVKADLAQRRAAAERRAKAQIEVLLAEMTLRRCRDTAEALEHLQMRMPLDFRSLNDLLAPQPWAIEGGLVLGNLFTMEEVAYQAAIQADAFEAASLDEALRMEWTDADEYQAWTTIYIETLRKIADEAISRSEAMREREQIQQSTVEATGSSKRREGL